MILYEACVTQMAKMLGQLDVWLGEAVEYAESRDFDPDRFLHERLHPDMFALTQQIQSACDTAKFAGSRLTATEAASDPDDETTLAQLRARIQKTIAGLRALDPSQFEAAADREFRFAAVPEGKVTRGLSYFIQFAQPNFYFHVTTAYGLLRRAGVKLGKRSFIGSLPLFDPES
ncbi:MAG: DUF1993 domain-containing protein [Myxococcota bacterium]